MSKKPKVKNSKENAQKRVDYEKLRKRNEKLRKELIHHVKIHKESVKVSGLAAKVIGKIRLNHIKTIFSSWRRYRKGNSVLQK